MTTYKKCPRCSGTGIYAQRGVCFGCNGAGVVVADPFLRVVGTSGQFYGITGPVINGKQLKAIDRGPLDLIDGYTATAITEEQARKFFKRYGLRTEIPA